MSLLRHPSPPTVSMNHPSHYSQQVQNGIGTTAVDTITQKQRFLANLNEEVWQKIGNLNELTGDLDNAIFAYHQALRHNQWSVSALTALSHVLRTKEKYPEAMEFLKNIIKLEPANGEAWGNLGHCYLMMDNLQEAYSAYQQALYYLPDPKEPKLWYGIGILYDRYGSLDHAEEAFSQVMRMQPNFEKANEIYFRLGIIYKQQSKFAQSLECFKYIVSGPPPPLNEEDIWFQIGHVHEQQKDYESAKNAYRRVLERDPKHAKVLQQLGWLHHNQSVNYQSQEQAIEYLEQSVGSDNSDAQSWYLLGRCYMAQQKFPKAYEAYQQAVYRDGRNPTFWCSIGVLYYQINQYRDALDAYSRAIRLNPYISEVWYDLGTLYESCNNQTSDALDAYQRAAELDPTNNHIKARLNLLRNGGPQGAGQHAAPIPQDVHPQAYQNGVGMPPGVSWNGQNGPQHPHPPSNVDPARVSEWQRGIAGLNNPPTGPPQHAFDREQQQQQQQHQQQQPMQHTPPRFYHDVARQGDVRKQSLSPKIQPISAGMLPPGPQVLPGINNPQERTPHLGPIPRPSPSMNGPPGQQPQLGPHGPPGLIGLPPYGRAFSPPAELRPNHERPPSPASTYHMRPHYNHMPNGMHGPSASQPGPATEASRMYEQRDERPQSAMKRHREWEQEQPNKKPASEENKARMEEYLGPRRYSPPHRMQTPRDQYRRSSSEARREDQRRADQAYHPSEAAHHPYSLQPQPQPPQPQHQQYHYQQHQHHPSQYQHGPPPQANHAQQHQGPPQHQRGPATPLPPQHQYSMQAGPPPHSQAPSQAPTQPPTPSANMPPMSSIMDMPPKSEPQDSRRQELVEAAARKVDVDEDYDNSSGDDKRASRPGSKTSPNGSQTGGRGEGNGPR